MACKLVCIPQQRLFHRTIVYAVDLKACYSSKNDKNTSSDEASEVTKESLQWRTPWDQKDGQWFSKLKIFATDKNNVDMVKFLQTPIDFRPTTVKKWFKQKQQETERQMQQYIPKRNEILGNDLAAAHFIVYRGGSVKFHGEPNWIKHDDNIQQNLPNTYVSYKKLQAIDCKGVNLYYEGLANFRGLKNLEWLSVNGCNEMDDWCMDRISGMMKDSLVYLDLRNCNKITERGIGALYRNTKLKTLLLDDCIQNKALELTCLMLQELLPKLEIKNQE